MKLRLWRFFREEKIKESTHKEKWRKRQGI